MNKKKIFSGTFYPLQLGEIIFGRDHYNNKIPLLKDFDIMQFCYSNENKLDIISRIENEQYIKIIRFNEKADDLAVIESLFEYYTPNIINFHGGVGKTSGQKGTSFEIIKKYKNSGIKFLGEYGGGYDSKTMISNYYNNDVDGIIFNHNKWKEFFPKEYQDKIYITPKQQSVDSNFFIPMDIEKKYDIMTLGRYDNNNKGHGDIYKMFNNTEIKVLLKGNDIPSNLNSNNIRVEEAEYNHERIREVYNQSKIFVWGTKEAIENPFCIHVRVVIEAVACGLPVVAYKNAFQESNLLINNYNSFLVESEKEFVEKVKLLLNDKSLYEQMSKNSRLVALECDISKFYEFYKNLWNSL